LFTPQSAKPSYTGNIVILCNEQTQSQAEYTIMMFQGATKVTVIGSQTAGADGNVTEVVLPGGYAASFSGLGIYYPDGTPTQRIGIKIDIPVKPTLEAIRNNRDKVLQRAMQYIANGK
jgi:C-terminal processing protease CtpA/Prc